MGDGVMQLACQLLALEEIATAYGAQVTVVDSTEKLDMLRSVGANLVIDYTQEDFTRSGELYDLILDIASNRSWPDCRRALTPEGTYVLIGHDHFGASSNRWIGSMGRFLKLLVLSPFDRRIPGVRSFKDPEGDPLAIVTRFIEDGKITPVIDSTFPLSEVVEAIRHMEAGHARGKIIITVSERRC